jgi:hypothetical protein
MGYHNPRIGRATVLGTKMVAHRRLGWVLDGVWGTTQERSYKPRACVWSRICTCVTSTGYVLLID